MQLSQAFGIKDKEVVSFVGGGGKTTAMFRLAAELVQEGKRVVTTTTTRLFVEQARLAPVQVHVENAEQAIRDVRAALSQHAQVVVVGPLDGADKVKGIEPALVDEIAAQDGVDIVVVEADGARMLPFKVPDEHEPVLPHSTTLLVPVCGIDAVGVPLDDEHIHRAERLAALLGVGPGTTVEPDLIARAILNPGGGLKHRPPHARVIPLINKVQNAAQTLTARAIASRLLKSDLISAVAIGSVTSPSLPIAELQTRVAAIILAAGGATRMGGVLKQLLPWRGTTLIRHMIDLVAQSQVGEIIVVVGNRAEMVQSEIEQTRARLASNPDWAQGRSTSVRAGIEALSDHITAVIFINADQPFLTTSVIDAVVLRYYQTRAPIVVPLYDGKSGSPVLFARDFFGALQHLKQDEGGKQILDAHRAEAATIDILNNRAAIDVDTMEQYHAALAAAETVDMKGILPTIQSTDH